MDQEEKSRVTGYMPDSLVEKVEEYAESQDVSRSKALNSLVESGLESSSWDAKVTEGVRMLSDPEISAFLVSVVTPDGETEVRVRTRRPGYNGDDPVVGRVLGDLDDRSIAQYLTYTATLEMLADQNDMPVKQAGQDLAAIAEPLQERDNFRITEFEED